MKRMSLVMPAMRARHRRQDKIAAQYASGITIEIARADAPWSPAYPGGGVRWCYRLSDASGVLMRGAVPGPRKAVQAAAEQARARIGLTRSPGYRGYLNGVAAAISTGWRHDH